jgi:hypothetical protein
MSVGSSSDSAGLAARRAGVKVARDASKSPKGAPQKVTQVVRGEIVFVGYNDERGVAQTAMYFKVGDALMSTPDTTEWCAKKLFPIADWMKGEVMRKLSNEAAPPSVALPSEDSVDVMAGCDDAVDDVAGP